MEYRIELEGQAVGIDAIREAIHGMDPAALVDLDAKQPALRVATTLGEDELVALLANAGHPAAAGQVTRAPSVCCGGCGG